MGLFLISTPRKICVTGVHMFYELNLGRFKPEVLSFFSFLQIKIPWKETGTYPHIFRHGHR